MDVRTFINFACELLMCLREVVFIVVIVFSRLCDEYEKIAEKALTSPANTEHLMELMVSQGWSWLRVGVVRRGVPIFFGGGLAKSNNHFCTFEMYLTTYVSKFS